MYETLGWQISLSVCVCFGLYVISKAVLARTIKKQTDLLLEAETRLRTRLNHVSGELKSFSSEPKELVSEALGGLGIDGIIKQLGIDPKILSNPLVKGLIEKYAPRLIESMAKKTDAGNDKEGFGSLL